MRARPAVPSRTIAVLALTILGVIHSPRAAAQEPAKRPAQVPSFHTLRLSDRFLCEGASFGDFDRDGHGDVVSGPFVYSGPEFTTKREIAPPTEFDRDGYSENFFAFPHDFDRDGWLDVFFIGFPGQRAWWAQNPRGAEGHWTQHTVFAVVDNESPTFADVSGDGRPELVCLNGGRFGYASFDPEAPAQPWTFHAISSDQGLGNFTHGMGVGDVNGDGRPDLLEVRGWWEQPASLEGDPPWTFHEGRFGGGYGGAQMFATDVDGDGDADVISSLNAHVWGLSWFEQVERDGAIAFVEHRIMGSPDDENPGDVCFSELHALDLADMDGDGLKDVVTGKRWWSHGDREPGARDPAVLYWWKLRREGGAASFEPHLIHDDSGVGVQVVAGDVDGDGRNDVVVGNKKGTFVHLQRPSETLERRIERLLDEKKRGQEAAVASPRDPHPGREDGVLPVGKDGRALNFDFETGDLRDWTIEGDAFADQPVRGDSPARRQRESSLHQGEFWLGGYELQGDGPHGKLLSAPFVVTHPWASFLIGGGPHEGTAVELAPESGGQAFLRISGASFESMQPVVLDLGGYLGRSIRIRIVDREGGHWGHVNFDDFRFHAERPSVVRPAGVPEILEQDVVAHAGLPAEEAARAMTVPAGFRVDVIAAEPDVVQPIALAIDGKARLWVVQALSYPQRQPEGQGRDSIVVFEDRDADGSFETRTVFADRLNLVSGIEVGFGGVFVGAAPYLLFIPDSDDDLVPDGEPQILLDGWGYEDTHETLNAFVWGPDGWLYGCHGVFTHARVGKPGTPDEERVPANAAIWRFHPQRREFEIFSEGTSNPWGVDFDDYGQAFCEACVIPHLFHCIQGGRYIRQAGRHFNPYAWIEIDTIADHRHYAGPDPYAAIGRSGQVGGGHAHCGALLYLGDQFPPEYRNTLLMGNVHGNRINRDAFERDGSGWKGVHRPDFLVANDRWFRQISAKTGPDGSVYFIDWYDAQTCHHTDPNVWNRGNGRLYRVSYGEPSPAAVDVGALNDSKLVALQLHPNDWWVRHARRELQERGAGEGAVAELARMATQHADPTRRLRAMWALHAVGAFERTLGTSTLDDGNEHVRAWTMQLLCERSVAAAPLLARMEELAKRDPSPVVRLYLASALQRLPLADRWPVIAELLAHGEDAGDPNLPTLYWYALEPLVGADPGRGLALRAATAIPRLRDLIVRRAAAEPRCHEALVQAIAEEKDASARRRLLEQAHAELQAQRGLAAPPNWPALHAQLASDPALAKAALDVALDFGDRSALPRLRAVVADRAADSGERNHALQAMVRLGDEEAARVLQGVLDDPAVRGAAVRALAGFADDSTPAAILRGYAAMPIDDRRAALSTLASRASWGRELLSALGRGDVARSDVPATVVRQLRDHRDDEIERLMKQHFGIVRDTPEEKAKRIGELRALLTPENLAQADLEQGRALFAATCMKCHALFGAGRDLAPELTGSNRADLDYLLTNVVDPNSVIGRDYQVTNVFMKDGRVLSGILAAETASSLTIVAENETTTVARADVESSRLSNVSLMPEGQLDAFEPDRIRDLFAYLQSDRQVPMAATEATALYLFDGATLALWSGDPAVWSVEDGAIVGRTREGLAKNSFLVSDLVLGDFRLTVDVLLAGDLGNSGIQFRSRPLEDGEVMGYQADVGPGWWGKLYEESARGTLSDVSGESFIRRGEWNTYEIWAVGSRVRTALNGRVTTDLDDKKGIARGRLALQVHSGGPTEVRFRGFRLELDPPAPPETGAGSSE